MNAQHQLNSIFNAAVDIGDPDERDRFVEDSCRGNNELKRGISRLLNAHFAGGSILDSPPEFVLPQVGNLETGKTIGPYKIREQIGEGGMGIVYVAEQTEPVQRKVALKIVKPGMDTKEVIARFAAERQALAFMEHPNIARVLDAGATESGRSYFVMELVRGIPITEYCDQVKATARERLELFQAVCDAVQHAHQKGIIHRDIKPSNVLVTQIGAKPVVKVIDFGLAKAISGQRLTERTLYTGFMKLMGTPAYMSPEQAGLSGLDIDTRSDIYSLGVLLYELLTGTTPLDKTEIQSQAYDELCRQIREVDAPKPSTRFSTLKGEERTTVAQLRQIEPHGLRQLLDGDLDRVVLKAIEKDRDMRYGSPLDLASDIERFLYDKPVLAVPPSQWYLARKYMRRNKVAILTAAIVLACLILATSISTWQAIVTAKANRVAEVRTFEAERSASEALAAKKEADEAQRTAVASDERSQLIAEERRRLLYVANMQAADQQWHSPTGTPKAIDNLLTAWIPTDGKEDLRDLAWRYQWTRLHQASEMTAVDTSAATISPSGNLIIADKHGIREWDDSTNSYLTRWRADAHAHYANIALSPCGRWAAAKIRTDIQLISIATGDTIQTVPGTRAQFATGGDCVLICGHSSDDDFNHKVFDVKTGANWRFEQLERSYRTNGTEALSADGRSFFYGEPNFLYAFFADQTNTFMWRSYVRIHCCAWSPNGELMVTGHFAGQVRFRFSRSPDHKLVVNTGRTIVKSLAFSTDSRLLAVGGSDGTVDIYNVAPFYEALNRYKDNVTTEGERNTELNIQDLEPPHRVDILKAHTGSVQSIVYSKDNTKMATRDAKGVTRMWRLDNRSRLLPRIPSDEYPLAGRVGIEFEIVEDSVEIDYVDPAKHELISGSINDKDKIISISDDKGSFAVVDESWYLVWRSLAGPPNSIVDLQVKSDDSPDLKTVKLRRKTHNRRPNHRDITFTHDGSAVVVAGPSGAFKRSIGGQVIRWYPEMCGSAAISADGRYLALDNTGQVVLWDLQKDQLHKRINVIYPELPERGREYGKIAFAPDGKYFAIGTGFKDSIEPQSSALIVWESSKHKAIHNPLATNDRVFSEVTFTPDSKQLIATDHAGVLRFWNTSTWDLVDSKNGVASAISAVVSNDGKWIAQGGYGGIAIFDGESRERCHLLRETTGNDLKFSSDGRTLVAAGVDGSVVWLDVKTGKRLATMPLESGILFGCDISPQDDCMAALSVEGDVWIQDIHTIEEIDRHPQTLSALYERGRAQQQNNQFADAEATLSHVLRLQSESQSDHADTARTRQTLITLLSEQDSLPTITRQPRSHRIELGSSVTLGVEAEKQHGTNNCRYQWFFNNDPIVDATQAEYAISSVSAKHLGDYRVEVYIGPPELKLAVRSDIATVADAEVPATYGRGLRTELFYNVPGKKVDDLTSSHKFPHLPDQLGTIDNFELPSELADNYGAKIEGFVVPPKTGEYVFYVCSDDSSELYLSSDESRNNKRRIAYVNGWKTRRQWEELGSENISEPVTLLAGKRYCVEALFKEGTVGDDFAVTWQMPDEPPPKNGDPPIPGEFLEHLLE